MIDHEQLWRFLDEPWETVPPVEPVTMTPEELKQVGGGMPPLFNM